MKVALTAVIVGLLFILFTVTGLNGSDFMPIIGLILACIAVLHLERNEK